MRKQVNLNGWTPEKGKTGVVQFVDFGKSLTSIKALAAVLNALPDTVQSDIHSSGCVIWADLSVFYKIVHTLPISDMTEVKRLHHLLQDKYPEMFGSLKRFPRGSVPRTCEVRLLDSSVEATKVQVGYRAAGCPEPIILEPEDWNVAEWTALCKMCGVTANTTERIVLNLSSMEVYTGYERILG